MATTDQGGVWRTINGYHVFIKDGQTASEAIAEQKQKEKTKTKEAENKPKETITDKPKDPVMQYESAYKLESPVNDFDAAQAYLSDDDMTQYLPEELKDKISSAEWILDDDESGRVVIKATEELTPDETKALQDWIDGQNSDGLGEGFEQQEFATSYWNPETGEGPFTYREFEQEQERMYDELEPYEYADYLDDYAVDAAVKDYMEAGGFDLDDEDALIAARQEVREYPEEYLDWEDIAHAKDEYFKDHGGSNEDEWYAMSSMSRDGEMTGTPIEAKVPEETEMTEANWVDQNIETLKSDYKNETGKDAFENGRATREFAAYNTNRYEELKNKFNRGEIEPYSAEDYELRDLKYQKAIDDGILTQEEVDYLKTKEDWQMDKASRADVDNAKHYMEEAQRTSKPRVLGQSSEDEAIMQRAKELQNKIDWGKASEAEYKEYQKLANAYEIPDMTNNGGPFISTIKNKPWEEYKAENLIGEKEQKAKETYMSIPQEERVKAYEEGKNWKDLVKEQDKSPFELEQEERKQRKELEDNLRWFEDMEEKYPTKEGIDKNKEYQALKEDYENTTGKKWNTPDDFELTAKKIIKDNTNNHKIWLWPDKEGKYNPETDRWQFIGMEGIMGGQRSTKIEIDRNGNLYEDGKLIVSGGTTGSTGNTNKASSKSISDNLSRAAYNKYLKEHPGSKISFEDFKKKKK